MLQKKLIAIFGDNYKTTLSGIVTAGASFFLAFPQTAKWEYTVPLAQLIVGGGIFSIGAYSKDATTDETDSTHDRTSSYPGSNGMGHWPNQNGDPSRALHRSARGYHHDYPRLDLDVGGARDGSGQCDYSSVATEAARRIQQVARAPVTTASLESEVAQQVDPSQAEMTRWLEFSRRLEEQSQFDIIQEEIP
jgi:hypothetical protein